jgi:hypothetical protein
MYRVGLLDNVYPWGKVSNLAEELVKHSAYLARYTCVVVVCGCGSATFAVLCACIGRSDCSTTSGISLVVVASVDNFR